MLSEEGEDKTGAEGEAGKGEIEFSAGAGEGTAAVFVVADESVAVVWAVSVFWKLTETAASEEPVQSEIMITAATNIKVIIIDMTSALLSFKRYFPHMDIKAFIFGLAFRKICPYNNC